MFGKTQKKQVGQATRNKRASTLFLKWSKKKKSSSRFFLTFTLKRSQSTENCYQLVLYIFFFYKTSLVFKRYTGSRNMDGSAPPSLFCSVWSGTATPFKSVHLFVSTLHHVELSAQSFFLFFFFYIFNSPTARSTASCHCSLTGSIVSRCEISVSRVCSPVSLIDV